MPNKEKDSRCLVGHVLSLVGDSNGLKLSLPFGYRCGREPVCRGPPGNVYHFRLERLDSVPAAVRLVPAQMWLTFFKDSTLLLE